MGQLASERVVKVGDKAPLWSGQTVDGSVSLEEYLGQSAVLLFFYPADWSDICRDELPLLEELVMLVGKVHLKTFGINSDSRSSHKAFAREIGLSLIKLVSDPHNKISEAYGVLEEETELCRRSAVLIDPEGIVRWVQVEPTNETARALGGIEQALEIVREWNDLPGTLETWRQERQQAVQLRRPVPLDQPTRLQVRFWGTRGSVPVSGTAYTRYGGNTSCVSLTSDTGHLFIFDCGSGARELGLHLLSSNWPPPALRAKGDKSIAGYIFLSHTHWDHIQGFPFFAPVFEPGNRFNILGWSDCSQTLGSILAGQMEYIYFPVSMNQLPANLEFYSIRHGRAELDGGTVEGLLLKDQHPTPSTSYRVELNGKIMVYSTDHEPLKLPPSFTTELLGSDIIYEDLVQLAKGADILIHDAQYSATELKEKEGWGHSSVEVAVDTAIRARVKKLVLFHHDPYHDDATIEALLSAARTRAAAFCDYDLEVIAAYDGLVLEL